MLARRASHTFRTLRCDAHDSQPRPTTATLRSDDQLPPAHLVRGYASGNVSVQLGVAAYVDDFGALPIAFHCYDGNRNGHTGIREQLQLIRAHQPLPANALIVSDRGTFSAEHLVTYRPTVSPRSAPSPGTITAICSTNTARS